MNDRRKKTNVFHINLLKKYNRRVYETMVAIAEINGEDEGQDKDVS